MGMFSLARWGLAPDVGICGEVCYDPVTLAAMGTAVASAAQVIAPIATVAGTVLGYQGAMAQGKAAQAAANYEAQQMEMQGKEELAAAGAERDQLRRKKELAQSTLQANAAASGFSATDPTALNLAEDIEEYGTLQEQMAMYGGSSRAAGRKAQAEAARMTGRAAMQGARYKAMGTVLSGVSTLADRYNPTRQVSNAGSSYGTYYGSGGTRHTDAIGPWRTSVSYG
jgi:hypothetical protein